MSSMHPEWLRFIGRAARLAADDPERFTRFAQLLELCADVEVTLDDPLLVLTCDALGCSLPTTVEDNPR